MKHKEIRPGLASKSSALPEQICGYWKLVVCGIIYILWPYSKPDT